MCSPQNATYGVNYRSTAFSSRSAVPVSEWRVCSRTLGETPSGTLQQQHRVLVVADALARLPSDYRDVVMLRNFRGLSFREVAAKMQRSDGAVRMLWLRALQDLRSMMRDTEL